MTLLRTSRSPKSCARNMSKKACRGKTEATKLVTDAQRTASLRSEQILHDAQESVRNHAES